MTKNPYINVLCAVAYIALVATFMTSAERMFADTPDTFLAPVILLSLVTLSAAMMAMIFFYRPIRMYLDGDKEGAVSLLSRTIIGFAIVTVLFVASLFIFR